MPDNQNSSEWVLVPRALIEAAKKVCAVSTRTKLVDNLAAQLAAAPAPAMLNGVEGLVIQWRHNAQGCGRRDQHAAGTWRSCARELEAALRAADNRDAAGVPAGEAVAWAIRLGDGTISPFGWNGMPMLTGVKRGAKLVNGADYVFAYEVTHPPAAEVDEAMVERACKVAVEHCWPDYYDDMDDLRAMMRAALTAARLPAAEVREVDRVLLQEAEFVHDEYIRGFNDGVKAARSAFDAIGVVLERDSLKEQLHDEIAANLAFREAGGAMPDEDMPTFCGRLIAERNAVMRIIENWRHDAVVADSISRLDRNALRACADELDAALTAARLPAAEVREVDARAAKALLSARSHIGARRPDDEDDAAWWDELTELAAALSLPGREGGSDA